MFSLRKLQKDERGQALVMGAVSMLVVVMAVMATVAIAHGTYEKIKLQDAADAQAYSTAVKQARAFNFIAYTNRAMVVHYCAMLTVMAYVSHAVYLDQTIGTAAEYLRLIPAIGSIFATVETIISTWKDIVENVSRVLIPLLYALNVGLWLAQEALVFATVMDIYTVNSSTPPVHGTDPKAEYGYNTGSGTVWSGVAAAAMLKIRKDNAKNFLHIMDDGPRDGESLNLSDPTGSFKRKRLLNKTELTDPDFAKYRLLMGNIVNSARREWTAVGKGPLLIGRRWNINVPIPPIGYIRVRKRADTQIKSFHENFDNNRVDQLYSNDNIEIDVRAGIGWLSTSIWDWTFRIEVGADAEGGFHRSLAAPGDHHDFKGISPFFTSDPSFFTPWKYHFGYPCNIALVRKPMNATARLVNMDFSYRAGDGDETRFADNGKLDMTWEDLGDVKFQDASQGMQALAAGRAIYHRPGDWKEEPNFFNPLWTARLAPLRTHWLNDEYLHSDLAPSGSGFDLGDALFSEWLLIEAHWGGTNY